MKRRVSHCSPERPRGPTKRHPEEPALRFLRGLDRRLHKIELTLEKVLGKEQDLLTKLNAIGDKVTDVGTKVDTVVTGMGEIKREGTETRDAVQKLRDDLAAAAGSDGMTPEEADAALTKADAILEALDATGTKLDTVAADASAVAGDLDKIQTP